METSLLSSMALTKMLHGKVISTKGSISYLCWSFGEQLDSYLQVTGLKSWYSYGVCSVCKSVTIFELKGIRHLLRLNNDLVNK